MADISWEQIINHAGKHCWVCKPNGVKMFDFGTFKHLPFTINNINGSIALQKGDIKTYSERLDWGLSKDSFNKYKIELLNY